MKNDWSLIGDEKVSIIKYSILWLELHAQSYNSDFSFGSQWNEDDWFSFLVLKQEVMGRGERLRVHFPFYDPGASHSILLQQNYKLSGHSLTSTLHSHIPASVTPADNAITRPVVTRQLSLTSLGWWPQSPWLHLSHHHALQIRGCSPRNTRPHEAEHIIHTHRSSASTHYHVACPGWEYSSI